MCQELAGSRRQAFRAACRRLGIAGARIWVVPVARGELAVIQLEGAVGKTTLADLLAADTPFEHWLGRQLREMLGVDVMALAAGAGERVLDWHERQGDTMSTETAPPTVAMAQLITGGLYVSRALYVAAHLGIADLLAERPRAIADLAAAAGAQPRALYRVLRALASIGIFAEDEQGRFGLTPLGDTLRSDVPGSLRALALFNAAPWHTHAWDSLLHGVQTGETPIVHATGQSVFEYFMSHPEQFALFDQAMISFSSLEVAAIQAGYDFSGIGRLVDVGGGHGLLLGSILQAHPSMRGVLYDLPPVIEGARQLLGQMGVLERCELVAGDFFQHVPAGGDAYILKNIVHDFDDATAQAILGRCRAAMEPGTRLLIVQEALPEGNAPSPGKLLDMQMLLIGGCERTASEYRALLEASGFSLSRIVPLPAPLHVIEATPVLR
jgi:hypothetical protein